MSSHFIGMGIKEETVKNCPNRTVSVWRKRRRGSSLFWGFWHPIFQVWKSATCLTNRVNFLLTSFAEKNINISQITPVSTWPHNLTANLLGALWRGVSKRCPYKRSKGIFHSLRVLHFLSFQTQKRSTRSLPSTLWLSDKQFHSSLSMGGRRKDEMPAVPNG